MRDESPGIELWAGVECSVVRIGDRYVDENVLTGHATREGDLERLAETGVRAVRYPVLWERTAPEGLARADWRWSDARLGRLRELGIRPIVGLVHHGSGPRHTSLLDASFVSGIAEYARGVAERYPWVDEWTPLNELVTTARFSALYGHWYPHAKSMPAFLRALVTECQAVRAAMKAVRTVNPRARLVQTEDGGKTYATKRLHDEARFQNERQMLGFDLLTGRVVPGHPFRRLLRRAGISEAELASFVDEPCPPDVIGLNYYFTSDRFLDHRSRRYPAEYRGGNRRRRFADIEALAARRAGMAGHQRMLERYWKRYRIPVALTEVHLGCRSESQIRWLETAWKAAHAARERGADVRAVTIWSAFGSTDWDSLLTLDRGHYEPGMFDVRARCVRRTALASVARELATTGTTSHPAIHGVPWWETALRYKHAGARGRTVPKTGKAVRPILVAGGDTALGMAVVAACRERRWCVATIDDGERHFAEAIATERPWALIDALGPWTVDHVRADRVRPAHVALARQCARRGIRLAMLSTDLVFDGRKATPYVESDRASPLSAFGRSRAEAERRVLEVLEGAVVVRTSAWFGAPYDDALHAALLRLGRGERVDVANDAIVSPTYVPDLAHAALTLVVDGASGVWHVANVGATTHADLVRASARAHGLSPRLVVARNASELGYVARRPALSALSSERGALLGPLEDALERHARRAA